MYTVEAENEVFSSWAYLITKTALGYSFILMYIYSNYFTKVLFRVSHSLPHMQCTTYAVCCDYTAGTSLSVPENIQQPKQKGCHVKQYVGK